MNCPEFCLAANLLTQFEIEPRWFVHAVQNCRSSSTCEEIFPYTVYMTKIKVLIVDDEPAIREVLEMILQEWGYEVRKASDGAEAREMVESYDPDIIVSDVVMP